MSDLSVEEVDELVEAFRYIGLTDEADALEITGSIDAVEWGLEES